MDDTTKLIATAAIFGIIGYYLGKSRGQAASTPPATTNNTTTPIKDPLPSHQGGEVVVGGVGYTYPTGMTSDQATSLIDHYKTFTGVNAMTPSQIQYALNNIDAPE